MDLKLEYEYPLKMLPEAQREHHLAEHKGRRYRIPIIGNVMHYIDVTRNESPEFKAQCKALQERLKNTPSIL